MDIATLIGLLSGLGVVGVAIALGGDFGSFVNVPSLLVVFGGTMAATFIKFPMKQVLTAFKTGANIAFKNSKDDPQYIYDQAIELAGVVRKNGLLGLQEAVVENDLFQKGLSMCLDGHNLEVIRATITQEAHLSIKREEQGEKMFRGIGDTAPAFGMIGTLVGLVQMLSSLSDPGSIGPAMAVAMLTTFYGALIANLIALPMANKMATKAEQSRTVKDLIIESIVQLHGSQNPMVMAEILGVYLPGGAPVVKDEDA